MPISKGVDQKTVAHFHDAILCCRKKEGTPTLCDSMDGTGEHYAKEKLFLKDTFNKELLSKPCKELLNQQQRNNPIKRWVKHF